MSLKRLGELFLLPVDMVNQGDREFDFFREMEDKISLFPLLVSKAGQRFRLIYGHHLLRQFTRLGFTTLPAINVESLDPKFVLDVVIRYHRNIRDVLPSELAKILLFMEKYQLLGDLELARLLKISDYLDFYEELKAITSLAQPLQDYLDFRKAPLKVCYLTSVIASSCESFLVDLVENLSPSLSIYTEIVSGIYEASRREGVEVSEVVSKYGIAEPIRNKDLNSLREVVKKLCFPLVWELNERIKEEVKRLRLPGNIGLSWDWTLERKAISINIEFDRAGGKELRRFLSSEFYKILEDLINRM